MVMVTVRGTNLDGRVRDELEGADDEEEHAHDVFVALEGFGQGQADFWLDLVGRDEGEALEFEEDEGVREDSPRPPRVPCAHWIRRALCPLGRDLDPRDSLLSWACHGSWPHYHLLALDSLAPD